MAVSKSWQGMWSLRPLGPRLGLGAGSKGFGAGGVGGARGPRNGANFATCVVFLAVSNAYKKKKNDGFFEGCPVARGGVQGLGGGGPRASVPGG